MALTGNEIVHLDGAQADGQPSGVSMAVPVSQIADLVVPDPTNVVFTAVATGTPMTLPLVAISGAPEVVVNLTAVLAAAGTVTLPTVASLAAAVGGVTAATSYKLRIINSSSGAFAWTVATNTGWTLTGPSFVIAQDTYRDFVVDFASATAATLFAAGNGSYT